MNTQERLAELESAIRMIERKLHGLLSYATRQTLYYERSKLLYQMRQLRAGF